MSEAAIPDRPIPDRSRAGLPGSNLLTNELLDPATALTQKERSSVIAAAAGLPRVLADLAAPGIGGPSLRITDHQVRLALGPADLAMTTPFTWSARTARRTLGLRAVQILVARKAHAPVDAARMAIADAIESARAGDQLASPMGRWLAALPAAGITAVQADAATWATRLWCALDWEAFEEPPVIGRDRWWDSPHSALLAIRSRAEVRSVVTDKEGSPFSVHLVVLAGPRRPTIRSELSVLAMVESMQAPRSLPPGRIVGWWPDSGHLVKVEIDGSSLAAGVAAIARTLARTGGAFTPFEGVAQAAA
jgi:hypothetical protein